MKLKIIAILLTIFALANPADAQRRNLSYDRKFPKGYAESVFVRWLRNPNYNGRWELCLLAGGNSVGDRRTANGWRCEKVSPLPDPVRKY